MSRSLIEDCEWDRFFPPRRKLPPPPNGVVLDPEEVGTNPLLRWPGWGGKPPGSPKPQEEGEVGRKAPGCADCGWTDEERSGLGVPLIDVVVSEAREHGPTNQFRTTLNASAAACTTSWEGCATDFQVELWKRKRGKDGEILFSYQSRKNDLFERSNHYSHTNKTLLYFPLIWYLAKRDRIMQ